MLPSPEELRQQADWLAPARAALWRAVGVGGRRRILDLGAGSGAVTGELVRRGGGMVLALDILPAALRDPAPFAGAGRIVGDAVRLPLARGSLDLVFAQLALLWMPAAATVAEVARVLAPGGAFVALEPDYGGLIEEPPEVAVGPIWRAALARAGADPLIGRRLPRLLARAGFRVRVNLFDTLVAPSPLRFELLRGLPLTAAEAAAVDAAELAATTRTGPWEQVGHLPFFLVTAMRS